MVLSNNQGQGEDDEQITIYTQVDSKLMLWLGYLSILYLTGIKMSVSYLSTTFTNILNAIVVSTYFIESFNVSAEDLNKLNMMNISAIAIGAYLVEFSFKIKLFSYTDKKNRFF